MKSLRSWWKGLFWTAWTVSVLWGAQNVAAQEDGFFFDVGADYLTRAVAKHTAVPALLGGHLGLGYSLWRFDMSAETAFTVSQEGQNPKFSGVETQVSGLQIPILLKGGFSLLQMDSRFKLKPELFLGFNYTNPGLTVRDQTVVEVSAWSLLGGVGLRGGYQFGQNFGLYLGAYFDYRINASDSSNQSANFQFKAGVQIHPFGGGSTSTTPKKGATRSSSRAQATPYSASAQGGAPSGGGYSGGGGAGADAVLLSALRGGRELSGTHQPLADTRVPNSLTYILRDTSMDAALAGKPSPEASASVAVVTAGTPNGASIVTANAGTGPGTSAGAPPAVSGTTNGTNGKSTATPASAVSGTTNGTNGKSTATPPAAVSGTANGTNGKSSATPAAVQSRDAAALKADIAALKADVLEMNSYLSGNDGAKSPPLAVAADESAAKKPVPAEKGKGGVVATAPSGGRQPINLSPYSDTIYYTPNETKIPVAYSIPTLDAVGKKLQEDDGLIVIVKGYAAPAGTVSGQHMVSERRARYCADYLNQKWDIDYGRMKVEWYGAGRKSEQGENYTDISYNRAVDLVVVMADDMAFEPLAKK
ncbi:MAG: OmpA family protein [Spirochaetaceae bacterium]|jgi:outer membrane protein OmpA-like peptidoglycan-associated protein|nr:OmpA family protein [Spirochaetaceae bacterium]